MKKITRIIAVFIAAVTAAAMLVVPSGADGQTTGYWYLTGKASYCSIAPAGQKKTEHYIDRLDYFYREYTVDFTATGGRMTKTETVDKHHEEYGVDLFGNNNKITGTFTAPESVYKENDVAKIKLTISAKSSKRPDGGSIGVTFVPDVRDDDNSPAGFSGGVAYKFVDENGRSDLAAQSKDLGSVDPAPESSSTTVTFPINRGSAGDKRSIVIYCSYMYVVYNYEWRTGEPPAEAQIAYLSVTLKKGSTLQLGTVLTASSKSKATWSSSKKSVASVSSGGKITARSKGSAVITAKLGSSTVKIKVNVTA